MNDVECKKPIPRYNIPWTVIFAVFIQTIALIVWGTRIDFRLGEVEKVHASYDVRFDKLNADSTKLILIEERQRNVIDGLQKNGAKIDTILDFMARQRQGP